MSNKEIRWKQRFLDFNHSLSNLKRALSIKEPDDIYRAGIIQFFEVTFELAWKTLKDYLEAGGYNIKSPRETIQQAFMDEIILDGHIWIDALQKRNLIAHTCNEDISMEAYTLIKEQYIHILEQLSIRLNNES